MNEILKDCFTEKIKINGIVYEYLMTSDWQILADALKKLGCRLPNSTDYRYNPQLSNLVREKMIEKNAKWSLTVSNGASVLNYFSPNKNGIGMPFIVFLQEIMDLKKFSGIEIPLKVDFKKEQNLTPLIFAIINRNKEIVRFLAENGADVNFCDSEGITPLMFAAALNEPDIIRILISHGADVNSKSKNGISALVYAIFADSLDAVKILKENNADLNICIAPRHFDGKQTFSDMFEFFLSNYSLGMNVNISLIYKRCGMSKQQFSKIRSKSGNYRPQKRTALQLAIGMKLSIAQTEQLLESAGYFFDEKNKADQIVKDFISHLNYDIFEIDRKVFEQTGKSFLKDDDDEKWSPKSRSKN